MKEHWMYKEHYHDGTTVEHYPNGKVITRKKDGTSIESHERNTGRNIEPELVAGKILAAFLSTLEAIGIAALIGFLAYFGIVA